MENTNEVQNETVKVKLLPSPYNSTLVIGAEIDLADWRYRCKGGALQLGYAERESLYIFTYGRSAEEELDSDLLRSRVRLGLLGISLLANSNGIVLYNGSIGRPIRTSMDFSHDSEDRASSENKIIRLKHERYPEFRYSVEPLSIAHLTHADMPMAPEVIAAIDELSNTGKVSIKNLVVLSNTVRAVSQHYEPEKNWNYKELWTALRDKARHDLQSHFVAESEEMKKVKSQILTSYLKWMDEMEDFAGLSRQIQPQEFEVFETNEEENIS